MTAITCKTARRGRIASRCEFATHRIAALQNGPDSIKNFHVVDTLGTLERADPAATGSSGDWQNEIHPNAAGYRKLGEKIVAAIESLLVTHS